MFINSHLLAEPQLYHYLRQHLHEQFIGVVQLDISEIKKIVYATWHQRHIQHTDQNFLTHWTHLIERQQEEGSLCRALLAQAARYHFDQADSRQLAIRQNRFGEWQNWLSNQSGLPVIAFSLQSMHNRIQAPFADFKRRTWLKATLGYRSFASPFHPIVEDYIAQQGLNESHMHLNGTTTMEAMWHFALLHPEQILQDLEAELRDSSRVQLLYATMPHFNHPRDFGPLLRLARHLRQLLIAWVNGHDKLSDYKHTVHQQLIPHLLASSDPETGFYLEQTYFGTPDQWTHIAEIDLHLSVIEQLKHTPSTLFDACYWLYLLSMNLFQRIQVQRDDQIGFEQFQKFADNGIRDSVEKEYKQRFYQLHGPNPTQASDLLTLEGRFAPKRTAEKNEYLIRAILKGFLAYKQQKTPPTTHDVGTLDLNILAKKVHQHPRPQLRLVAHFIKQPWHVTQPANSFTLEAYQEPHFHQLRDTLLHQGQLLFQLLEKYPHLRQIVTGVDAAANELETPPEVFAVLYRQCRRQGIQHFTYHAGEDFEHLLSGIRAIYEAIEFLDLKNGDRLGHATAIGIEPQRWIEKMPDMIFLTQGQWLENLLFLRHIALEHQPDICSLSHLEAQIHQIAWDIFGEDVPLNLLQEFFSNRSLSPDIVHAYMQNKPNHYISWRYEEYLRIQAVKRHVLNLLQKRWFDRDTIQRYEKKKEFILSFTSAELLLSAQQFVQDLVAQRNIVIETLPTSNVRISHYSHIQEHHIFRWIQIPERTFEGDKKMTVALGSDDPGIFVTDMRNEFYHLFSVLVEKFSYPETEALRLVAQLNENGRIYRFDGPNIL